MQKNRTENRYDRFIYERNIPDISISSNKEASVTGIKGITEYTQDFIRLNCGHLLLTVKGKSLNMTALSPEEVIIKGEMSSFEFSHSRR